MIKKDKFFISQDKLFSLARSVPSAALAWLLSAQLVLASPAQTKNQEMAIPPGGPTTTTTNPSVTAKKIVFLARDMDTQPRYSYEGALNEAKTVEMVQNDNPGALIIEVPARHPVDFILTQIVNLAQNHQKLDISIEAHGGSDGSFTFLANGNVNNSDSLVDAHKLLNKIIDLQKQKSWMHGSILSITFASCDLLGNASFESIHLYRQQAVALGAILKLSADEVYEQILENNGYYFDFMPNGRVIVDKNFVQDPMVTYHKDIEREWMGINPSQVECATETPNEKVCKSAWTPQVAMANAALTRWRFVDSQKSVREKDLRIIMQNASSLSLLDRIGAYALVAQVSHHDPVQANMAAKNWEININLLPPMDRLVFLGERQRELEYRKISITAANKTIMGKAVERVQARAVKELDTQTPDWGNTASIYQLTVLGFLGVLPPPQPTHKAPAKEIRFPTAVNP